MEISLAIISLVSVIMGGFIGAYFDIQLKIKSFPYWFIGFISGLISGVCIGLI